MKVRFPAGWLVEVLGKQHRRDGFDCGEAAVNDWLRTKARQSAEKNLSITHVILDETSLIAGYYTLAFREVPMDQLPQDIAHRLPDQPLPFILLAWMGVDKRHQGRGIGDMVLAEAFLHCHRAAGVIPFVGVILDCLNEKAKQFYARHGFLPFPASPMKLLMSKAKLEAILRGFEV